MRKKLLVLSLCVALAAIAIAGASLAYFTDTKSATNTFTVGNVKIDLIESKFHREGNGNSNDTSIRKPTNTASGMKYVRDGNKAFTDEEIQADAATYKTDYLDVFNYRETVQKKVFTFLNDKTGVKFLAENLLITQLQIEQVVKPKLIIVKNKDAWMFLGRYAAEYQYENCIWMGYILQKVKDTDCGEVYQIKGLIDNRQRVGYDCLKETQLIGTLILFTKHYQYCKAAERPTAAIIQELYNLI